MQHPSTLAVRGLASEPPSLANAFADTVLMDPRGDRPARLSGQSIDSAHVVGMVNALGVSRSSPRDDASAGVAGLQHHVPLRFSGSGVRYFGLWLGHLLLTVVSLGLLYPWARARRLRYFHEHLWVGDHAMRFEGRTTGIAAGALLATLLVLFVAVAVHASPVTGLMAWLLAAGVWPILYHSALKFRFANTTWRGLRFRFEGRTAQTYAALLPVFVPGAVLLAASLGVPAGQPMPGWFALLLVWTVALTGLAAPWWYGRLKRLQHAQFGIGPLRTELRGARMRLIGVAAETALLFIACAAASGALWLGWPLVSQAAPLSPWTSTLPAHGVAAALLVVLTIAVCRPFFVGRMQNLLWSRTGNAWLRFKSELRLRDLMLLTWLNMALVVASLGLYWPFARVATMRLRLQAVTLITRLELDELVEQLRAQGEPRTASSLFTMDVGW